MIRGVSVALACFWLIAPGVGWAGPGEPSPRGLPGPPHQAWYPRAPGLPKPAGPVIRAANVRELFAAAGQVPPGGTILVADGHYLLTACLDLHTDNVTLRSESAQRDKVVLDGAGPLDNTPEFTVPKGHFFMMGDNRDNSLDSRVPAENIVARGDVVVGSYDFLKARVVWDWVSAIRFNRFFHTIA